MSRWVIIYILNMPSYAIFYKKYSEYATLCHPYTEYATLCHCPYTEYATLCHCPYTEYAKLCHPYSYRICHVGSIYMHIHRILHIPTLSVLIHYINYYTAPITIVTCHLCHLSVIYKPYFDTTEIDYAFANYHNIGHTAHWHTN